MDVGQVLLGSWPSQVAGWGREAIAAYVAELQAHGITPDGAIQAMRSSESKFPPSAGELQHAARQDPSAPTWDEAWLLIRRALTAPGYADARRQHFAAAGTTFLSDVSDRALRDNARQAALAHTHPTVQRFVAVQGWERLAGALDDEWGPARVHELHDAWDSMVDATDSRQIAALASGRRDGLRRLDPLGPPPHPTLPAPRPEGETHVPRP